MLIPVAVEQDSGAGYVIDETDGALTCVVTGPWTGAAEPLLAIGTVDGLVLNYAMGFCESDLSFIKAWPLRRLSILDRSLVDLHPLRRVGATLEELSVQAAPGARLDLGDTPRLRFITGSWELIRSTVNAWDQLQSIITMNYDDTDLLPLVDQSRLSVLTIKEANRLESLRGVAGLVGLEKLGIHLARRLTDVGDVASCATTLSEFRLEYCSRIMKLDPIAPLTRLTALAVADCRSVDSLRPLSSLAALEKFLAWGSTRIMDADLSPLLSLPRLTDLRMKSRREYKPSVKEVQSELVPPVA